MARHGVSHVRLVRRLLNDYCDQLAVSLVACRKATSGWHNASLQPNASLAKITDGTRRSYSSKCLLDMTIFVL